MKLAVVGGGPAGLRAAEIASQAGAQVTLYDAKASVGRKLLVAGRGGLNITKDESPEIFARRYEGPDLAPAWWDSLIRDFSPNDLREWAAGLGIETFAASTGRVYPREMKAAPLLRRWVHRLKEQGVTFAMHHRLTGLHRDDSLHLEFQTQSGPVAVQTHAAILALGGGSWPETGSDGGWIPLFDSLGLRTAPLQPANCGWELPWLAELLAAVEGQPVKNITARVGDKEARGELLITSYGLEGGALYQLGSALRAMPEPAVEVDLKPDVTLDRLIAKMGPARRNLIAEAGQRWKLPAATLALLQYHPDRESWQTPADIAQAAKHLRIALTQPRPIAEAISSAGGLCWSEIDDSLMVKSLPGVFVAGEMIDWEAPTGGYLMQGCFATGAHAARHSVAWMQRLSAN